MSETLSSAGVIGQIISAILSILDLLKDGIGPIISSLIDTIFNAITGILDNILSGDLFKQIGGSLVKGIGGLLNTVSFGGFNKLFGIGGNAKEVQAAIDRLTDRNELLQTSIEDLTDTIKQSQGRRVWRLTATRTRCSRKRIRTTCRWLWRKRLPRKPPQLELLLGRLQPGTDRQTERADWPPVGREPVEPEPGGDEGAAQQRGHVDADTEHRQGRLRQQPYR
jgi:hypothetical protein